MPTLAESALPPRRKRIVLRLTQLAAAVAAALAFPCFAVGAMPDTALRASDQLDLRRLGGVSGDEQAVLRVEWHAASSRLDEEHAVQDMLDRLRRIELTVRDVNRLVMALPAQTNANVNAGANAPSAVEPVAAATPSFTLPDLQLPLAAAGTALALMVLWRRRKPETQSAPLITSVAAAQFKPVAKTIAPPELPKPPPAEMSPAPSAAPPVVETPVEPEAILAGKLAEKPDETLELAEIMLSMGLAQGAAQTLVEHIRNNPREALFHWLKLLEIYRTSGHRSDFKNAAEQLRQHFNIQAEDWTSGSHSATPTLEDYPRVATQLTELWPQPADCIDYLLELLSDNRGGTRAGFPQPVAEEILLLMQVLKLTSGISIDITAAEATTETAV
jgi:hypothetical protein